MLCGKQLILATKPFAKENRTRSWLHTLTTIISLIVSFTAIIVIPYMAVKMFFSLLAGLLLVRMFVIYHDHQHHTILAKSPAANFIMTAFGLYMLAPTSIWKRSHDHHHNHNSKLFSASIGSFPIATRQKYLNMTPKEKFSYLAVRHPLTIGMSYISMFVFGMCISSFLSAPKKHIDALIALLMHAAMITGIIFFLGWQTWLLLSFFPMLIACGFGSYLFYAQHNFPAVTFATNKEWAYEKAALESSSYMRMNSVMAWFTANIGYHHIHHLNSKIPFYRLPEVMNHFPELQACKKTSLQIREVITCLRLKIWDVEKGKMTSLEAVV
ncbi:MAG: fatty acid desaturase [Chitinophagaceae bacterium]|nr:fatty acid desaturase [Chitinophagaceae bacterium]